MMAAGHWKIVLFLFAVFTAMAAGVKADCNPPANGDWTINGTDVVVCENRSIVLNGSLLIEDNASFTLNNGNLFLNQTNNWTFYLTAKEDSSVILSNSSIDSGYKFGIELYNKNNTLKDMFFNSTGFIYLYGNSNNRIENSIFNTTESFRFFENSTNSLINSTFYNRVDFEDSSGNAIQNSNFKYIISYSLNENSSANIQNSAIDTMYVFSRGNNDLTIRDFRNGTNSNSYFDSSNDRINFSNVNITNVNFYAYDNSINKIINSTFYDVWLTDNSTSSIINSTISYFEFGSNSTIIVNSSIIGNINYPGYYYDYSHNSFIIVDNSNVNSFSVYSRNHNLTIKDFTNGTNIYGSINSTTGLEIILMNTNVTDNVLEVVNNRNSTLNILNSSFNNQADIGCNSSTTIIASTFYNTVWFPCDTTNKIENSTLFGRTYFYGYPTNENEIINSIIVHSEFNGEPGMNNTIINTIFYVYVTDEGEDGTNLTYREGDATFKGNSINTIQNSSFKHAYFEGNSVNTIMDSLIDDQLDFKENSVNLLINLISNSSAYFGFEDNSSSTIENSTIFSISITSNGNKTIKIQDLNPGFINGSVTSNTSSFKVNITNTNITGTINFVAAGTSINTIINSTIYYGKILGDTTNIIENSTFNQSFFDENSINYIKNTNFIEFAEFRGNSVSTIENSIIKSMVIRTDNGTVNISNLNRNIGGNYINTTGSSYSINITNTTVSEIGFYAYGISNNYLENNNLSVAAFAYNSTNTIKNSSFGTIYMGGYAIINFTDNQIINNISAYIEGTSWQPRIYGFVDMPLIINFFDYNLPDASITRYFPIYVYDQSNNTMSSKIIEIKYNDAVIWTGTTDDKGYVEPSLIFNSSNYNATNFDIYATGSPTKYVGSINLLTDTPISLTYVYDPPSSNDAASNNGGGGGCVFRWECGDWSECSAEGKQIRKCENKGTCSGNIGKPSETRDCAYIAPKTEEKINVSVTEEKKEEKLNLSETKETGLGTITGSVIAVNNENKISGLLTILGAAIILAGILIFLYNHYTYKRKMEIRTKQNN